MPLSMRVLIRSIGNAMKYRMVIILILATVVPTSNAGGIGEIETRNSAAGFAGTLKFFIGRTARDCKPYLNKDDDWMRGVVNNWMSRNGDYAEAAEVWTSAYLTYIANQKGMEEGLSTKKKILEIVTSNANAMTSDLLTGNDSERAQACTDFENRVMTGMYDITEELPQYKDLEDLVKFIN
jgi:hypothetical protein